MNSESWDLVSELIPRSYVQQAADAARQKQNTIQHFLRQRKWPLEGWNDDLIEFVLSELSFMDSNNIPSNCGLGEREGRIISDLVARRHFRFGHGIGRSGNLTEVQPKAVGSSLINQLTNSMLNDLLTALGISGARCLLVPVATGMALVLSMLALKQIRPAAKFVIWSRIDQKSCFKSIITAGFTPVIVDMMLVGDELQTDIEKIKKQIIDLTPEMVLCVMTTTSCFAPRACDSVEVIAEICQQHGIPQLINNAYGLSSSLCMQRIRKASLKGRVDIFVQSTDKNLMVPVGGSIIASFDLGVLTQVSKTYPGRASASPTIDVFITLLSLGKCGYMDLVKKRSVVYDYLKSQLENVAAMYNERILSSSQNQISIGLTLSSIPLENLTKLGSMLFIRNVSGTRVITTKEEINIGNLTMKGWGSHCSRYTTPYLTAAASLGSTLDEVDIFIQRLHKVFKKCLQTKEL